MNPPQDLVTSPHHRDEFRRRGFWDDVTLAGQVAALGVSRAGSVAVVDEGGECRRTYAELAADAGCLAARLRERGLESGDVVSVQLPNWYEAAVVAVAIQSIGAVINPLLPNYRARELTHAFSTAPPAAVVTPGDYRGFDHRGLVSEVVAATGLRPFHIVTRASTVEGGDATLDDLLSGPAAPLDPTTGDAEAVSELIFTSGTEASPKAIMHTEQTTNFSVRVAFADLGLSPSDVVWMPSPVGHSTGFNYGLRFALYHGLPLVLQDRWDADAAVEVIEREQASYTLAATTFLQDLVEAAERHQVRLEQLRCFGCGGAPVPAELVRAAAEVGIGVLRLYGSTEVLVGTWNRPDSPFEQRLHTDGVAMTDVEVEIRGHDERSGAGEIFVRGPNTCVGFYADPERTAATFDSGGWVRSGDLGVMNPDGALTVSGRKKEIIIRGGINIAPREIEELLVAWPEVERAAVVGVPDPRLGERSCACVVLRPGQALTFEIMVDRLRSAGLAAFKLPEQLEVLDALPTTASGKVQKHEIVRRIVPAATAGGS